MILTVNDLSYAECFSDIYNSAIMLFKEEERGFSSPELFIPQLKEDINYIYLNDEGVVCGFMSFNSLENQYIINSLYVRKEFMRTGIGSKLVDYFEKNVAEHGRIYVKALKNAPWSIEFYKKHGYMPIEGGLDEAAKSIGLTEKPWSVILRKQLTYCN